MALQVMAPQSGNVGANIRTPKLSISVPEFKNFGPAPEIVNPVGEAADGLFKTLLAYQQRKQKIRDNEDLSAAVNDLQKQTLQFQSDWKGTHFGTEARDAGKIFSKNVDDMALKMIEERFKGRPELEAAFRQRAATISFNGFSHGTQYDDQQDIQYRKATLESQRDGLSSIIATGTDDNIAMAVRSYKEARASFFPGINFADDDRKVNRMVHAGLVERSITEGNMAGAKMRLDAGVKAGAFGVDDVSKITSMIERGVIDQINLAGANGDIPGMKRIAAEHGYTGKTPSGNADVSAGVAQATAEFAGKTRYGFGSRDPKSGSVDCSGWAGYLCEVSGIKGFKGKTADELIDHAWKVGRKVDEQELFDSPQEGMLIGIDTGDKGWDKGRKNGIDHVVMTFKDPNTGKIMVSESSSKSGVHAMPADEWIASYRQKGAKFFAGDVSSLNGGTPPVYQSAFQLKMQGAIDANMKREEARITESSREATALAQYGDPSKLKEIESALRSGGFIERADQYATSIRMFEDTKESRKWAAAAPLDEVRGKIEVLNTALDPERKSDATGGKKTLEEYEYLDMQRTALSDVYNDRVKAYQKDPAAAADADGLSVPEDATMEARVAARMEMQRKNGVPEPMALTKQEVDALGMAYENTTTPATFITQVREQYGKQADIVMKQLVQGKKIPLSVNLIADMTPSAGGILARTSKGSWVADTEKNRGMENADKKDLRTRIEKEIEDAILTIRLQGDQAAAQTLVNGAYGMALYYMESGMDQKSAVQRAASEIFMERYTFEDTYRIPSKYDAKTVSKGIELAMSATAGSVDELAIIIPSESGLSDEQLRRRKAKLVQNGRWITNQDETGLVLCVGSDGTPFRRKNGKLVQFTFDELVNLGKE